MHRKNMEYGLLRLISYMLCAVILFTAAGTAQASNTMTVRTTTIQTVKKTAPKTITANASANWAGYTATGSSFTGISGSWKVPAVQPSQAFGADAAWVGIGGIDSSDLIQSGTEAVTQNGIVQYIAWTEALPAVSRPLAIAIHAGDTISVTISEIATNSWHISLQDNTSGQSVVRTIPYVSSHSSAEWIEEAPSDPSGILPLDNFHSVTFSNASVQRSGTQLSLAALSAQPVVLAGDDGSILAQPSTITRSGNSFSVTRIIQHVVRTTRRIFGTYGGWNHGGKGIRKRQVH